MRLVAIRRAVQIASMSLLVALPVVGAWSVATARAWTPAELEARYGPLAATMVPWLRRSVGAPPEGLPGAAIGGAFSISLFGVELTDPIAAASLLFAGIEPTAAVITGAVSVLVLAAVLGRFFCGWLCPYGILSRLITRLRAPLVARGWVHRIELPRGLRYGLLAAVVVAPLIGTSLVAWLPYLAASRALFALSWGGIGAAVSLLVAWLLTDLLLWDQGTCRSICPAGALQALAGRRRILRLHADPRSACTKGCSTCIDDCWLGLDPRAGGRDPDCDACGRCVRACPTARLTIGTRAPRHILLAGVIACGAPSPPERLDPTWNTPFMPPVDQVGPSDISFVELDHGGKLVSVGTCQQAEEVSVRVYLEKEPGEPYTGPLNLTLTHRSGDLQLPLERPLQPRSARDASIYEVRLRLEGPASVRFEDGPAAGLVVPLPGLRGPSRAPWVLPGLVIAVWALLHMGAAGRGVRKTA